MQKKQKQCCKELRGKLSSEQMKSIVGGVASAGDCEGYVTNDIYGPYNGGVYTAQTMHYHCRQADGTWGAWQTGPWGIEAM